MKDSTNRRNVTIAVMVATFLTAMDNTVVSTAMPTIVSELGGLRIMNWVFAAYLLTTAATTPIWGRLADLFGRKVVFFVGTTLFLLGSMLSGLAHTMDQLIWFRTFQGIGAGAVFPITLTIIGDIYSFEERARMQGLFSSVWGIAGILGPLVGGFFVDVVSWRWIFYINVPVGLLSMALVGLFLHERFTRRRKSIDYWGAITFTVGVTTLLYALLNNSANGLVQWTSPLELTLFAAAAACLLGFAYLQKRLRDPMLPIAVFTNRVILVSNLASFFTSALLIGLMVYLPYWIQGVIGHSATSAGLTLTPMSIGWPLGSTVGGRIMLRIGSKTTSLLGCGGLVAGSIWLATVGIGAPQWVLVAVMLIAGFGFGFSTTAFTVVIQSVVTWEMRGAATASNQFVRAFGQTIGIAAFGTWFNRAVIRYLDAHPSRGASATDISRLITLKSGRGLSPSMRAAVREILATGLHHVYVVMAGISVIAIAVVGFLPSVRADAGTQDNAPPAPAVPTSVD